MAWNFGDVLEEVSDHLPGNHPALIHGNRVVVWADLVRRTNNLGRELLERGAQHGDKIAFYMRNQPAYMELLLACFKARLVHVNVNYRYKADELAYIFDNSDSWAVVYDAEFRPLIDAIRGACPRVKLWIEVNAASDLPAGTLDYEALADSGKGQPLDIWRSPEDLIFIYTGGTTGMPKGVMWSHDVLMRALLYSLKPPEREKPFETTEEFLAVVRSESMHNRHLAIAPFMHAAGMTVAMSVLVGGGTVVTLTSRSGLNPEELWETVGKRKITTMTIVGDAFAKPMLKTLDEDPGRYDVSSVQSIVSSGVMWSMQVKQGLLAHMPQVTLLDSLGSTEAPACGASVTTKDGTMETSDFRIGADCKVFDDQDREVLPGSGEVGFIARSGLIPFGYYKDEEKTKRTFRVIDGVRYAIPGDMCRVEADGRLTLLGRSSAVINTGGEKVFAEEVEEIVKTHGAVYDAVVVGVPDERWGQAVVAVVALKAGHDADEQTLRDHVRAHLADYKVPKRVVFEEDLQRLPNGKANYDFIKSTARAALNIEE